MEGDCNVYAHSSLWMRPTRPDRYNMRMVYNQCLSPYKHCCCLFLLCRGITESELQEHMKKMHEYNELKDIGQMLLGKLGNWIDYSMGGLRVDRFIPPLPRGQEVAKCSIHHYYVPHRICIQNEVPSTGAISVKRSLYLYKYLVCFFFLFFFFFLTNVLY